MNKDKKYKRKNERNSYFFLNSSELFQCIVLTIKMKLYFYVKINFY